MTQSFSANRSVARQVALISAGLIAVVFVIVGLVIGHITERNSREEIAATVADKVDALARSVDNTDATNRALVKRADSAFRSAFDATLNLDEATGELRNAGVVLNSDYTIVDKFTRDTGGVATVFARKGDDFMRITTSLKKQDGERAMGTLLDRAHPAYPLALNGQAFTGRAVLFGKPYMTHYEPVKNAAGKVIAILFVGSDISLFEDSLKAQVLETKLFARGGVTVVDPRSNPADAVFVIHPSAAGKKFSEVVPDSSALLTALAAAPANPIAPAADMLGGNMNDAWAVVRKSKATGWLVVAEVSDGEAMAEHASTMRVVWAVLIAAIVVLGLGLFLVLRQRVSTPLQALTRALTTVAHGDLTQAFKTTQRDELGTLVNEVEGMRQRYLQMLQQVRLAVDSVSTASQEIATGNHDLSLRTEQTASNLQTTAQSMEELTATVKQSAESAQQANRLAGSASEVAARGGSMISDVVNTMNGINQSSRQIADITSVIDGIAFQTNILALNAAVEAARAGEQGRGFAVVASEVRSLAQRSAQAAKEIKALIDTSVGQVTAGSELVQRTGSTMQDIVSAVQNVNSMIGDITMAASEQSDGIGNVNHAVNTLDQMTQQNAALVEESAAAAASLQDQAARLAEVIKFFKLGPVGQADQAGHFPALTRD
ncbi:methyl-accepting chemotaxis protein [Variovorax sp. HJSM1_2]|uniref:methyl-accepting chemotaxis protein n=1 Tax=Variovorax sp. HJSM1_2 TaxID=3366263 RepID=UPI003BE984F4